MMNVRCCSKGWCHKVTWVWTKDVDEGRHGRFKGLVSQEDLGLD